MRILIVEDDFVSRRLMHSYLMPVGDCDVAVNGNEALKAFDLAWEERQPYDLICLDIMMPEMDGQQVLQAIRQSEEKRGIHGYDGVKIIMTTALGDPGNVKQAFRSQCEAYLVKPINRADLLKKIRDMGLMD